MWATKIRPPKPYFRELVAIYIHYGQLAAVQQYLRRRNHGHFVVWLLTHVHSSEKRFLLTKRFYLTAFLLNKISLPICCGIILLPAYGIGQKSRITIKYLALVDIFHIPTAFNADSRNFFRISLLIEPSDMPPRRYRSYRSH